MSKTVSFKPTPSSDLQYSPNTPTAQISSRYMANTGSYGEPRTLYGQLSIDPQASSNPADIHTHTLSRGLLSVSFAGSKDSIISKEPYTYDAGFHTPDMRKQVSPSVKGFQSSMLLPESVCIPSLHDPKYQLISSTCYSSQPEQVTVPNVMLSQSNETRDSVIHLPHSQQLDNIVTYTGQQTLPSIVQQPSVFNQTVNNSCSDTSMQHIQEQLQHQLNQVQLQLQRLMLMQ